MQDAAWCTEEIFGVPTWGVRSLDSMYESLQVVFGDVSNWHWGGCQLRLRRRHVADRKLEVGRRLDRSWLDQPMINQLYCPTAGMNGTQIRLE